MPEIPVTGFLLEALGAVAIALMLSSFGRVRPRPGVRDWSLGLWLRAAALVAAIAIGRNEPPLRTLVLAVAMVAAYWSTALLLLGTWCRWNDREEPRARRWLLTGLAVLGVSTTLVEPFLGVAGLLLRSGTFRLSGMLANLVAGVLLLRTRGSIPRFGPRVFALAFLGWSAEAALFLAIGVGGGRLRMGPDGSVLIETELVLLLLTGVGMVAWLLEEERESAMRLQDALYRKEALSVMGTIVGGVAHEVRNPLFGISATLDALAARSLEDKRVGPFLATMREQVEKLSRLMTELLDYGRPIATDLKPQSLSAALAHSMGSCGALAREAGVAVELVGEAARDVVLMDEPRLQQVFQNLVQNAIQHTPRSGRVTLEVRVAADDERPGVRCSVRDSGPGFEPSDLERVFEPFFTHRRGGTGLGLSIVQRIVEQHAGRVTAANHPQGGGVVTVWLPAPAADVSRTGSEAPSRS